jgi:hypothetical protein
MALLAAILKYGQNVAIEGRRGTCHNLCQTANRNLGKPAHIVRFQYYRTQLTVDWDSKKEHHLT